VLSSGAVDCWGENTNGELGNGTIDGPDGEYGYDTPQAVTGITHAVSATSDGYGYCAVLSSGGMDCWGDNANGELGNGTIGGPDGAYDFDYDTPQAVTGISRSASATSDGAGYGYCAVLSGGGMECWGNNDSGQSGNGTVNGPDGKQGYDTPRAVTGITNAVSATSDGASYDEGDSYCALLETGGVDCWGLNTSGELGNGTVNGSDGNFGYDTPQVVSP
jgi:alpha-tubulin suppressor-like RCC1 family protein